MTLTKTFPTDRTGGLPVADTRLIVAGMVECDASGNPRVGVFPSNYSPIVTGTSGMAYSVGPFQGVTSRSGAGAESVANDDAVSVATTAAPGANSRIDVIWVRSLYTTYADGSSDPVFGVTQGTAAALPTKPTIPAGALELATAVVLSTTTQTSTAVITQTAPYTAMEGGVVPLRNQAEQDAWAPAEGAVAYRIDTKRVLQRVGTAWAWVSSTCWTGRLGTNTTITASTYTDVLTVSLPSDAPAGRYSIVAFPFTWSGSATTHFRRVKWGATTLDGGTVGMSVPAGSDFCFPGEWQVDHTGGAVKVVLGVQVNGGSPAANAECRVQVTYLGPI